MVLDIIQFGVGADFQAPPLPCVVHPKNQADVEAALLILQDYQLVGAVREVPPGEPLMHVVPWFTIHKKDPDGSVKSRLITDCRQVNTFLHTAPFRLEQWQHILPHLRQHHWGAKVDITHAYFHLQLHPNLARFMNVAVGNKIFQFQSACFGLSPLPMIWMMVMKVLLRLWRGQGLQVFVYLDDILIIGSTEFAVQRALGIVLRDLEQSGLLVNTKKSQLVPTQKLTHLGFDIDFVAGKLTVPQGKLASIRKELGKMVTHPFLSCRKMAAILGAVRSFLTALPMLRSFTDAMMAFVRKHTHVGWDTPLLVPENLRTEVLNLKQTLLQWPGRSFVQAPAQKTLHSDSSQFAWGGVNVKTRECVQEFWRSAQTLHINVKEMLAAVRTLKSLSRPNEKVHLVVDNAVTFHYFRKGGGENPT